MVNFENGVTPINDTNLNKMQSDLQAEIDKLKGIVLYENSEGISAGSATISDDISNYKKIEVEIKGQGVSTTKVFIEPSGKLLNCIVDSESGTSYFVPTSLIFKIEGTTLTITKNATMVLNATEQQYALNNSYYQAKITKIVGYKEA